MLHFFRKIRRDLLANSQFFKYLKYAIGEIVLVVLGILIALYINNQNERRKEREKFDEILVEVENELIWNAQNALSGIQYLITKDSVCSLILFDSIGRYQLEKDSLLQFRGVFDSWGYIVEDKAFNKLLNIDNGLTEKQDSIGRMMANLFNKDSIRSFEERSKRSMQLSEEIHNSLRIQDWYVDFQLNYPYNEMEIEYYLNDPEHKKNAAVYSNTTLGGYFQYLQIWFQKFLKSYLTVYSYLENQNIQHNDSLHFVYDPNDYDHFIGKYKVTDWTKNMNYFTGIGDLHSEILLVDGKFLERRYINDSLTYESEIIPISMTCFMSKKYPAIGFYRIGFNEHNEAISAVFRLGMYKVKQKKIR